MHQELNARTSAASARRTGYSHMQHTSNNAAHLVMKLADGLPDVMNCQQSIENRPYDGF